MGVIGRLGGGLVLCGLLWGCSGGGGGSGGGGAGAAQGPITGFGSVFVTGDRWSTGGATIERDGVEVDESELSLGMVVTLEGSRGNNGRARADRIVFDNEVRGPVVSVQADGPDRRLVGIFGLTVVVDRGRTVFRDTSFDALAPGRILEVSGLPESRTRLLATFVEDEGPTQLGVSRVELEGTVSDVDPSAETFRIRGITVEIDPPGITTEIDEDLGGFVATGDAVEVEGILAALDRVLAVEIDDEDDDFERNGGEFEIESLVTDFVSLADFRVGGIPVDASGARFVPNRPDLVRNGARVEVEGRFADEVLVADEVKLRGSEPRIHAAIASAGDIDPGSGVVTLLGIPITVSGSLRFEDDRDDDPNLELGDLRPGDFLEVRGVDDGAGGVQATRIERDETDDVELRGRVEAFDAGAGTLTILGVRVRTDGGTEFENEADQEIGRAAFFATLEVGSFVSVKDDEDGDPTAIDVADEVEFEDEDDDGGFDRED